MILVVGGNGNMGQRYRAILRSLDKAHYSVDEFDAWPITGVEKVIIATPTKTHYELIRQAAEAYPQADILCEKPIVTSLSAWERLKAIGSTARLYCVNQYAHLHAVCHDGMDRETYYNYFKHGSDGLAWDCFQLFGVAEGSIRLEESSPIWFCKINGGYCTLSDMDRAYVLMLRDFLGPMAKVWDAAKIETTTTKVLAWISENETAQPALS
jgi:hypothetical protein